MYVVFWALDMIPFIKLFYHVTIIRNLRLKWQKMLFLYILIYY